jgi:hypothetical protein
MKKSAGIGIGIVVILAALILGMSSLPKEILIESPSTSAAQNQAGEEIQIIMSSESVSSKEKTTKEETRIQPVENTGQENDSQGNVIEIKVKDGIGSGDQ